MALTPKNATLNINWDRFLEDGMDSVNFTAAPEYTFVTVMNKIFAFYDPDDNASLEPGQYKNITTFDPHKFVWKRSNFSQNENLVEVEMSADLDNGTIGLKVGD